MSLQDIIKTDNIIRLIPDESLSSALAKLATSHDAGFVFSEDKKFMGVINPYYCIIKSSYPSNAKVEHCLYHPPHVHYSDSIKKVAGFFIDTKIHYLPVFDSLERFVGIVSARHLITQFQNSPVFNVRIEEVLKMKNKPLITVFEDDPIAHALSIFKKEKVSKLIVMSKNLKLKGIISYYDLISYLSTPKDSQHRGEREGNKINFFHLRVRNFAKSYVLTLTKNHLLSEALALILKKKIGSIVIVDEERYPIGIITTKDLLRFFIAKNQGKQIAIISKNLSKESRQTLGGFFNGLSSWVRKIPEVTSARLFVKEEKGGGLFKVVLSLFPRRGHPTVIEREGRNLHYVLKDVEKKKN